MYVFIINPKAGQGKGIRVVEEFLNKNEKIKNRCKTFYTKYEGHATELVEQITQMYEKQLKLLLIVGGDGTLYEAINGMKKHIHVPFSFVPVGSGNDFARGCQTSFNLEKHINRSFKVDRFKPYWLGMYRKDFKNINDYHLFASSLGFGFDAEVAERVNRSKFKKVLNRLRLTSIIYVIGLIITIFKFKPKSVTLTIDDEAYQLTNVWMLTISNHPYFGGGMKIAPKAKINKDVFTVTIVHQISKLKLLLLFITVFFGTHTKLKEVEQFTASRIHIQSKQALTFHADGATSQCHICDVQKEPYSRKVVR